MAFNLTDKIVNDTNSTLVVDALNLAFRSHRNINRIVKTNLPNRVKKKESHLKSFLKSLKRH